MLARRSYSARKQQATMSGSNNRSHSPSHAALDSSHLSATLRSRPIAIPAVRTSRNSYSNINIDRFPPGFAAYTYTLLPASPASSCWSTKTLVDASPAYILPSEVSDPAPPQESLITAHAAEKKAARGREGMYPVVYGNGRWVMYPRSGPVREGTGAERSLRAVLRMQEGAGDVPGDGDEHSGEEMGTMEEGRERQACCSLREWESGVACGKC